MFYALTYSTISEPVSIYTISLSEYKPCIHDILWYTHTAGQQCCENTGEVQGCIEYRADC